MTLPLKFRAWDKDMKRMRTVRCIHDDGTIHVQDGNQVRVLLRPGEFVVEQYTGLYDKNGRDIYEGDVLRYVRHGWRSDGHPESGQDLVEIANVYWHPTYCAFRSSRRQTKGSRAGEVYASGFLDFDDSRAKSVSIEVVGNIHENQELLREETYR